ncbi:hypothetical protein C1646_672069 [Rhizophagus diaphanus]|nr:hypothetical protein C1646_672069 [Rhizophagus diaphanus] [Rhizophagus sp. MUCL 43196]
MTHISAPSIGELEKIFYILEQLKESKIKGRKVNQKALKIMETENKFGVYYSRRDNREVKKISKAITRKEERKIALKERELQIRVQEAAARKAFAEAEVMELINLKKKKVIRITLKDNIKYNLY